MLKNGTHINCRTARTRFELKEAFIVLQQCYQNEGLTTSQFNMRVLPYHLNTNTQVFVASDEASKIFGTVTLIFDDVPNLPISQTYPNEMLKFNKCGEIASLAVVPNIKPLAAFLQLTRLLIFFARHRGLNYIAATVHPRHARFYQHAMGFEIIGEEKQCDTVGGLPGIPMLKNVNQTSNLKHAWKRYYVDSDFSTEELVHRPISEHDRAYFRRWCT